MECLSPPMTETPTGRIIVLRKHSNCEMIIIHSSNAEFVCRRVTGLYRQPNLLK